MKTFQEVSAFNTLKNVAGVAQQIMLRETGGEEESKTLKALAKKNMSGKGARKFTKNFDDNSWRSVEAAIGVTLAMEWKGPEGSEYSKYNKIADEDVIILLSIVEDVLGKSWLKGFFRKFGGGVEHVAKFWKKSKPVRIGK